MCIVSYGLFFDSGSPSASDRKALFTYGLVAPPVSQGVPRHRLRAGMVDLHRRTKSGLDGRGRRGLPIDAERLHVDAGVEVRLLLTKSFKSIMKNALINQPEEMRLIHQRREE